MFTEFNIKDNLFEAGSHDGPNKMVGIPSLGFKTKLPASVSMIKDY